MAQNFELAAEEVKSFVDKLNDQTKLQIYGLYKQATVGDVNIGKPGILDQKGRAKWDAWNANKGKSTEQAKTEYVQVVKANAPADIAKNL
ncbi:unnamed protein product [Paramecium octaurelia]|uniref:ACB domain-containing protein n=1 Tax=Paramecium octaurelia TaxID=43137 RepID=A0A8S1W7M5_PAROT|nr:unnamed protein product [Paramecium octaurelia]